eukprot:917158-Rhodomonas_salina.1
MRGSECCYAMRLNALFAACDAQSGHSSSCCLPLRAEQCPGRNLSRVARTVCLLHRRTDRQIDRLGQTDRQTDTHTHTFSARD